MKAQDVKELTAKFLAAGATKDKNTVFVTFIDSLKRTFVVMWDRTDAGYFDLSLNVMSRTYELNTRIEEAIKAGESDDNADLLLYLSIRDGFDREDCKIICGDYDEVDDG